MERDFYNEDIEQLLKQKADQFKMYPSDKVWKGIHRSLHTRRKWYWFSFVLFLAALSYYAIVDLIAPSAGKPAADQKAASATPPLTDNNNEKGKAVIIPFVTHIPDAVPSGNRHNITGNNTPAANEDMNAAPENITAYTFDNTYPEQSTGAPVFNLQTGRLQESTTEDAFPVAADPVLALLAEFSPEDRLFTANNIEKEPVLPPAANSLSSSTAAKEDMDRVNWLQEYAVYELSVPRLKRLSWHMSFAPTMNYRTFTGNKNAHVKSNNDNIPIASNIEGEPDKLVNHKPAIGFEIGSGVSYAINKNLSVRAGMQFNYARYDIQAYSSRSSELATIALNNSFGLVTESITSYTRYRNFGGDEVENLMNQYFQLSAPIGVEWRLLGNDKLQFGIAGTLQPTYLLNRNTYLITTDFKNYTQEPSLVRRWNMNASLEAFISYKTGELKWQVGPQVRNQLFSSYINKYPIRERLMEYGIKIGVAKTIR